MRCWENSPSNPWWRTTSPLQPTRVLSAAATAAFGLQAQRVPYERKPAAREIGRPVLFGSLDLNASDQLVGPLMVLITADIGRAVASPPPISLSTIFVYSGFGSTGVLPTICTTL